MAASPSSSLRERFHLKLFFLGNYRNVSLVLLLSPCLQHGRKQAEVKLSDAFAAGAVEEGGRRGGGGGGGGCPAGWCFVSSSDSGFCLAGGGLCRGMLNARLTVCPVISLTSLSSRRGGSSVRPSLCWSLRGAEVDGNPRFTLQTLCLVTNSHRGC